VKLVIFDCDGTLVDSQHMICAAMQAAFAAQGLPLPARERLLSVVGLSLAEAFTDLGAGADGYPVHSLAEQYKAAFQALRKAEKHLEPLYPGAREAIEELAARPDVVLGLATGKSRRGVDLVLGHHGLLDRFMTIQTADTAPSKPHPAMVEQAMAEIGVGPRDTVVVGDTVFDVAMAHAAGAGAIGVSWGYHDPQALRAAGAHTVIEVFANLLPSLDALWTAAALPAPAAGGLQTPVRSP
jgi:phosphoglycolate phosphatase